MALGEERARKAVFIGVSHYPKGTQWGPLPCCTKDAKAMRKKFASCQDVEDHPVDNFHARVLTSTKRQVLGTPVVKEAIRKVLKTAHGSALIYFSCHGSLEKDEGWLIMQDYTTANPGVPMNWLMDEIRGAMGSEKLKSVLLILDCCHAAQMGDVERPESIRGPIVRISQLPEGMTILAAARADELAEEPIEGDHGLFTGALLKGLDGHAADILGKVTAASLYAFAEGVFGAWEQRPVLKANVSSLEPIHVCKPKVTLAELELLTKDFKTAGGTHKLSPAYEPDEDAKKRYNGDPSDKVGGVLKGPKFPSARGIRMDKAKNAIFNRFKHYRDAGLLRGEQCANGSRRDLYHSAMMSRPVELTSLGQYYWDLMKQKQRWRAGHRY
ncbi:MAG: caspase family protein [Phycisphaerales bacterium]